MQGNAIRAWRRKRGYTLRSLEEKIAEIYGERRLTFVKIGRLENASQPYGDEDLEILANALDVSKADLFVPPDDSYSNLERFIDQLTNEERDQAYAILRAAFPDYAE